MFLYGRADAQVDLRNCSLVLLLKGTSARRIQVDTVTRAVNGRCRVVQESGLSLRLGRQL
jgi:hypothetical protein